MRELAKAIEEIVRGDAAFDGEFEFLPGADPTSDGASAHAADRQARRAA